MATIERQYVIKGNTTQAVAANEKLENSINQIDNSTKQLDKDLAKTGENVELSLKRQDAKIKAIGGSVNVVGGAVETVVGSLGLIGIDEAILKEFQQAATSAIAFADGTKRVFEGFKEITEARKLNAEVTNASTTAENSNTTALTTNAAAAQTVTVAQNTAAVSITNEKIATDGNTISKGTNTVALEANIFATLEGAAADDFLAQKTRELSAAGIRVTEAQLAETLAKEANATATIANAAAVQNLTIAQKAELAIEQALNKLRSISIGGWIAIGVAIVTAVGFIYQWIQASKEAGVVENELNGFLVDNIKLTKEQITENSKSTTRLKVLQAIISDTTQSEKNRKSALQELQKIIPDLEKIDLRRADAIDKIRIAIGKEIAALEQRAKAQAVQQRLTEAYTRQLELIQEVQAEFAKQGFQISEFEARVALERGGQVGVTGQLATEYQKLNRQIDTGTASLVSYAGAVVTTNGVTSKSVEITKQQIIELDSYNIALKKANEEQSKRNKEIAEEVRLSLGIDEIGKRNSEGFIKRASTIPSIVESNAAVTKKTYATQALEFQAFVENLQGSLIDFIESGAGQAIQQGLTTLSGLLNEFGNLQQEAIDIELGALERRYQRELQLIDAKAKAELLTAEEVAKLKEGITLNYEKRELAIAKTSLEQQKKLRRAQVIVTTAQSVIDAYSSTAGIPPPFGLIAGSLLAAAYIGLGSKAVANINATSLDGSDTPGGFNNIPSGGGFNLPGGGGISTTPSTGALLPGMGGRLATPSIGTVAEEPIRAYVLTGDISNGVQAGIALNNRRRLSGG